MAAGLDKMRRLKSTACLYLSSSTYVVESADYSTNSFILCRKFNECKLNRKMDQKWF